MRFYIASQLENVEMVRWFASELRSWGWQQTHDWTVHGAVQGSFLAEIAEKELAGVREADIVFVLLPGKRGTHAELGAANALGKKVIIWAQDEKDLIQDGRPCAFYYNKNATRIVGDRHALLLAAGRAVFGRMSCVV